MLPRLLIALLLVLSLFGLAGVELRGQVVIDNGLVVLLTEDFTGGIGTGPGEVTWAGSGGFAAVGGDRTVQIGGTPTWLSWDVMIGNANTLILGDPNADGTLIWDKTLYLLGSGTRRIRVLRGAGNATRADARLDRQLLGGALRIEGNGRLDMTANNTLSQSVSIYGAELRLNRNGRLKSLKSLNISMGGAFIIDNAGTSNSATGGQYISNRLNGNSGNIRLEAGLFRYIGQTELGDSIEKLNDIDLGLGANTIDIINNSSGFLTEVRIQRLKNVHPGATVDFISSSGVSGFGDTARLRVVEAPLAVQEILPYATVNRMDWAALGLANENGLPIIAYVDYNTGNQTNWNSTTINASPTTDQVLSVNRTINSLRLTDGRQIDLAGKVLTINAAALLSTGASNTTISGGRLTLSTWAYVHVYNTSGAGLTISSTIQGNGLTKTGSGMLTISGTMSNSIFGTVYVNEGMLVLQKSGVAAAIRQHSASRLEIGDRGHAATVRLDNREQIANKMNVWLKGGFADPARHIGYEATLLFNGAGGAGITETFRSLNVIGRGVIDFQGGTLTAQNKLILDDLWVRSTEGDSLLLVRNWVDFEDRLLVRRTSGHLSESLSRIHFEGYQPGAITRDYNEQFWEVVPAPEASTYGAIFSAVGLGLWSRRARLRCRSCERP